jgi:uncharacterized RDD family membrane protein YckC
MADGLDVVAVGVVSPSPDDAASAAAWHRGPVRFERFALGPVRAAARSSRGVLEEEAERVIDALLEGPLPEAVGRSIVEHRVVERVLSTALETSSRDGAGPELETLTDDLVQRMVQSPSFKLALEEVLSRPEIREAMTSQAAGFGGDVAAAARRRSTAADRSVEARALRLLGRQPSAEAERFGGFATRAVGLVLDAALAQLAFLVAAGSIALVVALTGGFQPGWVEGVLGAAGWTLAVALYFVAFWSTTGQTPGMRVMHVRVLARSGAPPSVLRSLVRFVGLIVAIIPLFAGFLPVLVDRRRRGLHDFVAGTVVVRSAD